MMEAVFWASVAVIGYVYGGYPLLLWLRARGKPDPRPVPPAPWPTVSLIIAAYNEERVLADKLLNSLDLDYPRDRLDIVVVSDGSTDGTDAVARGFRDRGVRLLRVEGRQGKTAAQNAAVAETRADILVFSDANALYDPGAIKALAARFGDPSVGCVEGRRRDYADAPSATARHELAYRDWESRLKLWESRAGSCAGATGAIYAVRRSLYVPLDPRLISDLMEPLLIVCRHGKRHVFEPAAISRETVLAELGEEFQRKVRIMTRCLNSLRLAPEVLNPFQSGGFALQVASRRLLRWLVPLFGIAALAAGLALRERPFYRGALLAQAAVAAAALAGAALDRTRLGPAWLRLPYYAGAANLAALLAIGNCLRGRHIVAWRTRREERPDRADAHQESAG